MSETRKDILWLVEQAGQLRFNENAGFRKLESKLSELALANSIKIDRTNIRKLASAFAELKITNPRRAQRSLEENILRQREKELERRQTTTRIALTLKESYAKDGLCEHGRRQPLCRDCKGSQSHYVCDHDKIRYGCRQCGGSQICDHGRQISNCKECGTHYGLLRGGFLPDEIKVLGAITICQFPNCRIQRDRKQLNSDHFHDGKKINTENYRGEVCFACNTRLGILDAHPEWASSAELEYMNRRPFAKKGGQIAA